MLQRIRHFLELIRFSHTVFSLPFALFAGLLAWHARRAEGDGFRLRELVGVLLCMVFARATAMAFNRLVDRKFDAENPRTAGRHLPAGLLSVSTVVALTSLSAAAFVASTLLFLPNHWPLWLSLPVLLFLCGYSYAKRVTALCHYYLGAALMLSPIAAWIAIHGDVSWPPVLLGLAVLFWVGGFDIIYACQDVEVDRRQGLSSIPARVGVKAALKIAMCSHVLMLGCLLALASVAHLGPIFLCGVACIAVLLAYEHWLVDPRDLSRVNVAFFNVNAVVSVGLLMVGALDLWWRSGGAAFLIGAK